MRVKYTLKDKKKIARKAKATSIHYASRAFRVDRRCIRDWIAQDDAGRFDEHNETRFRLNGGGRTLTCAELDELVLQEVRYERSLHHRVTRRRVLELASKVISEMNEKPTLNLSNGWLECFLDRHDLVMRRATNKPKLKKEAVAARGANFVLAFRELVAEYNITPANIINFDETAVFAEHNKNQTLEVRGATDVPVKSLGLEKVRVTAVFAARADGFKLTPCMMTKPLGKDVSISKVDGVVRLTSPNSWMNTDAFIAYVDFMFPFAAPNTLLLVFDSAKSHISKKAKAHLQARKILFLVIPGGLTPYLQPCDYAFFKPLKDAITESIDAWKRAGGYELTRGGNPKPPRESVVAGWLKAAWAAIPEAVIRRGFKSCFMGADDELVLWRHDVYGIPFMGALIDRNADIPDDMEISDDERDDDELDDGVLIDGVATIDYE